MVLRMITQVGAGGEPAQGRVIAGSGRGSCTLLPCSTDFHAGRAFADHRLSFLEWLCIQGTADALTRPPGICPNGQARFASWTAVRQCWMPLCLRALATIDSVVSPVTRAYKGVLTGRLRHITVHRTFCKVWQQIELLKGVAGDGYLMPQIMRKVSSLCSASWPSDTPVRGVSVCKNSTQTPA